MTRIWSVGYNGFSPNLTGEDKMSVEVFQRWIQWMEDNNIPPEVIGLYQWMFRHG